jgi:hypothetical protein
MSFVAPKSNADKIGDALLVVIKVIALVAVPTLTIAYCVGASLSNDQGVAASIGHVIRASANAVSSLM